MASTAPVRGYDALTHLDFDVYSNTIDEVVRRARDAGVHGWLVAGADPERWSAVQQVAEHTGGQWALGVHPWWARDATDIQSSDYLERLFAADPPVLGEIGLDHLRGPAPAQRARQRALFRTQLAWAREHDRPVALHCVRAMPELLQLLRRDGLPHRGGFVHGWTASPDLVAPALELGLHLSFGPSLLRRSAHKIRASVFRVPAHRRLLETDSPDQPMPGCPSPEPAHLHIIANAVADVIDDATHQVLADSGAAASTLLGPPPTRRTDLRR